ncbi:uncharacterized protein LOC131957428 isoform X2 [Physella acuta]|uniref:uncharacterized protein LOC131957428 isoform X2 n=1 Tax=Physella acuta TaxID=109671 RepID=UPI0027DE2653|nr:uncharacterized protein LOC131957428 isoform X2 [Physella acuta]
MESNGDTESDAQPKLTFADLNIPSVSTQPKDTPIGKIQRCQDLKAREILFMSLMLGSVLLATGFTIYRMAVISRQSADFSFGILLLINAGFCIWFTIDGVLRERPSEIVMLCLATIIILFYIIFNFALGDKNSIKLARLIVASISCPGITVVGLYCARKYYLSNHLIFRTVGAFQDMQNLYKNLLYFQDLLKFDLQVGCSIIVLVLDGNDVEVHEIVILSLGGAFKIVWFILGYIVMSREIKIGAWVFLALSPVEIAYIIFKMYDHLHRHSQRPSSCHHCLYYSSSYCASAGYCDCCFCL